jgi:hypothetical protein
MSDGQLRASDGTSSKETADLVRALPNWMPKDPKSGNFSLLVPAGRAIERTKDDIRNIEQETTLQYASKLGSIKLISEAVDIVPKTDETAEEYRIRSLIEFQSIMNEGTIENILNRVASIFDVTVNDLEYTEQAAVSTIYVPQKLVKELPITKSEFSDTVTQLTAAGYMLNIQLIGSLDFVTPEQYQSGEYDSEFGYDGLGTNEEPSGTGGTYSEIIS